MRNAKALSAYLLVTAVRAAVNLTDIITGRNSSYAFYGYGSTPNHAEFAVSCQGNGDDYAGVFSSVGPACGLSLAAPPGVINWIDSEIEEFCVQYDAEGNTLYRCIFYSLINLTTAAFDGMCDKDAAVASCPSNSQSQSSDSADSVWPIVGIVSGVVIFPIILVCICRGCCNTNQKEDGWLLDRTSERDGISRSRLWREAEEATLAIEAAPAEEEEAEPRP